MSKKYNYLLNLSNIDIKKTKIDKISIGYGLARPNLILEKSRIS